MAIRKASAAIPTSEDLLPYVVTLNDARTPLGKKYLSGQRGGLGKLLVGEEVVAGADRTRTEFFQFSATCRLLFAVAFVDRAPVRAASRIL